MKQKRIDIADFDIPEKLKERFSRLLEQNIKDIKGNPLTPSGLQEIIQNDPSGRGKYLRWMTDVYRRMETSIFLEDLYKMRESIELFEKVKFKLPYEDRNILNYQTTQDLWDKIKEYKDVDEYVLSKNQLRGDTIVEGEYDLLFENDLYRLIVVRTHRASCYWGSGTKWCTAVSTNLITYESYANKGPLVIIHYKDEDCKKNIQFHIETSQYMDYLDRSIDPEVLFSKYPEVLEHFIEYVERKRYRCPLQPNLKFYQESFLESLERSKTLLSRIFLAYGADVDGIDDNCISSIPICKAVYIKDERKAISTINMLLKYGAMTNVKEGFVNLSHMVASTGKVKILKLLVENGMEINVRDFLGRTPLHTAFMLGKTEMAKELIRMGLDSNEKDYSGKTPTDLAKEMKIIALNEIN
jgi:hypothetical protein